jgi:hypothetical protein
VSRYVLTFSVPPSVGGWWYWHLRCWDSEVYQHKTLAAGAVKTSVDPQLALAYALRDASDAVGKIVSERWMLPFEESE